MLRRAERWLTSAAMNFLAHHFYDSRTLDGYQTSQTR